jgi:hypothetical protein
MATTLAIPTASPTPNVVAAGAAPVAAAKVVAVRASLHGRKLTVRLRHATSARVTVAVRTIGQRPKTLARRTVRVSSTARTVRINLRHAPRRVEVVVTAAHGKPVVRRVSR